MYTKVLSVCNVLQKKMRKKKKKFWWKSNGNMPSSEHNMHNIIDQNYCFFPKEQFSFAFVKEEQEEEGEGDDSDDIVAVPLDAGGGDYHDFDDDDTVDGPRWHYTSMECTSRECSCWYSLAMPLTAALSPTAFLNCPSVDKSSQIKNTV